MIRKVERDGGVRWQVYGMKPPCTTGCKHRECAKGKQRKVYVGTYETEKQAQTAERKHEVTQDMIASGEIAPETEKSKRTLTEAANEWIDSLKANKSRSHYAYQYRMRKYVLPSIGHMAIGRITRPTIATWRDDISRRYSTTSVNGFLVCVSAAFAYFVERGWIAANPCHGVKQEKAPDRLYEWIKTKEEITKLLLACPKDIREIVTIAVATGMRLDEVLHLQWADISIERRLISVHRGRQGTTKSGKARHVPILTSLLPLLRDMLLRRNGEPLVFPGQRDERGNARVRSQPGVHKPFKAAVARAGLPKEVRFHDLRHTFASHWVLDGGDIFRLSKILGHLDVKVTQKTYAHLIPEAWEQDYHRVSFVAPRDDSAYAEPRKLRFASVP